MPSKKTVRKLAAILSADAVGYSRLMGRDEETTVRTITEYRRLMEEVIKRNRGRVVDSPGDNLLAEFPSVIDALGGAVEVQKELHSRNRERLSRQRMDFRIGINLGDVITQGGRLYGDGVNIAARLEGLAEPGGVSISGPVHDQVEGKIDLRFEFQGEQQVKNITKPVRVYRVVMDSASSSRGQETGDLAGDQAFTLPDKPSIAVLPFLNMSNDPEQDYLADGMSENIITSLSKIPQLFVIARNSAFTYKGRAVKVQQIGRELGVGYVLEGSVRRAGQRVRITAQLIEADTGHHLWAERYDRELKDIFDLQDEITVRIMREMQVKLTEGEQACEWLRRGPENLEAYERGLRGMELFRRFSPEDNFQARRLFEEGIALDRQSPGNYVMLAWTHVVDVLNGSSESPVRAVEQAAELAKTALALDESQADAHSLLGYIHLLKRKFESAVEEGEKAVALNPNGADAHVWLAMILTSAGRSGEAIRLLTKAMRLNPFPPNWYHSCLGNAYLMAGRNEEAVEAYGRALEKSPGYLIARLGLAASLWRLGRVEEAGKAVKEVYHLEPRFSLEQFAATTPFKNRADLELMVDSLRKAGLR